MKKFLAAAAQIDTSAPWEENLERSEGYVDRAAAAGAELIVFPENFSQYQGGRTPGEALEDSPTLKRMGAKAREHGMWILCGTLFTPSPEEGRMYNTSVLLDPQGEPAARYDKLHLFDATLPGGQVRRESARVCPGQAIVTAETELACFGMSVCYDVRFPELYRILALRGAQVFLVPAMFSTPTGRAHWELLLRARAVENTCYVIAADQVGGRFESYGHSMIVAPTGRVIAQVQEGEGLALGEIDPELLLQTRQNLPCLNSRRGDVYQLVQRAGADGPEGAPPVV